MSRRSVFVLGAAVMAVTAGSGYFLYGKSHSRSGESLALAVPAPGREAVLHVKWHESSTAHLPEGAAGDGADGTLTGTLEVEADLALVRERTTDDHDAIRAELRDVRTAHVVVSGTEVAKPEDAKSFEKKPIHFVIEDGAISRVLVDRDSSSLAVQLVEGAARQVLLARPPTADAKGFDREEQMASGTLRVHYAPRGKERFDRTVEGVIVLKGLSQDCKGACVSKAQGEGSVQFDGENAIKSLSDRHEIHAGAPGAPALLDTSGTFEAEERHEGDADGDDVALDEKRFTSKLPGEPFESAADKHASLVRLSSGASMDEIVGVVHGATALGTQGAPRGWLVRSTAYLELHPEAVDDLAARFQDEDLGAKGRVALLDVLASTGGDHAQATLLRELDTAAAREGETRIDYVQRVMLVEQPNVATATALRERFVKAQGAGDPEMAYAEAHVLGSVAEKLAAQGQRSEAKATTDLVAKALDAAKTPDAQAAYLAALGNAGAPTQVSRIAKHARDDDANVRRAVASALRKTSDDESKSTLLALAKDADEDVELTALSSISEQPIDAGEVRQLASLLDTPQLGDHAEGALTTLLLRQGPLTPDVQASLERLLARTEDPRTAAQIRFALQVASAR